jgi:hypothetical protein
MSRQQRHQRGPIVDAEMVVDAAYRCGCSLALMRPSPARPEVERTGSGGKTVLRSLRGRIAADVQAAASVARPFFAPRCPAKPTSISAHVEGSGMADGRAASSATSPGVSARS